jgi:hypothetical protein
MPYLLSSALRTMQDATHSSACSDGAYLSSCRPNMVESRNINTAKYPREHTTMGLTITGFFTRLKHMNLLSNIATRNENSLINYWVHFFFWPLPQRENQNPQRSFHSLLLVINPANYHLCAYCATTHICTASYKLGLIVPPCIVK